MEWFGLSTKRKTTIATTTGIRNRMVRGGRDFLLQNLARKILARAINGDGVHFGPSVLLSEDPKWTRAAHISRIGLRYSGLWRGEIECEQ
jgi:hypothetical protein